MIPNNRNKYFELANSGHIFPKFIQRQWRMETVDVVLMLVNISVLKLRKDIS